MVISIIIPFYNNQESVNDLFTRLQIVSNAPTFENHHFQYVLVDDGSKDDTYNRIVEATRNIKRAKIVKLTRNFGSYSAFLAGMTYATGDCCVHLHADLQDPPELIPELFEYYLKGFPLVIANRHSRDDANFFSSLYHLLVRKLAISDIPKGGFDLILFDKKIRQEIVDISEKDTNNVYLINWLGYPYASIPYKRVKRKHGKSQWAFWKKVKLFFDTFFSFSNLPINIIRILFCLSVLFFSVTLILLLFDSSVKNMILLFASSAIILFVAINALVISEYLIRIHETVRNRPNFVVENIIEKE